MNIYHIWADLKDSRKDLEFVEAVNEFLQYFQDKGEISTWRITRRKLGFGPEELGEFHIMIECETLSALDNVFGEVASREPELWKLHAPVFSLVSRFRSGLWRDFPDAGRIG